MGDNRINYTIKFNDGTRGNESTHYTQAIQLGRFAPLLLRTYPDLMHPHYAQKKFNKRKTVISLGAYEPATFVLMLALFVGPSNKRIAVPPTADFAVKNLPISLYNVVIMWSFIGRLRPTEVGFGGHLFTVDQHPDPEMRAYFDKLQCGFDAGRSPAFFVAQREFCRLEACSRPDDPSGSILYSRFFREGA